MRIISRRSMRRRPQFHRRVAHLVPCPPFVHLFQGAIGQLAHNPSLQREAWRVLLLLLSLLDDENEVAVSTTQLAARLAVPRQSVWRGVTTLAQVGCVRRDSPGTGIQLTPHVASRGLVTSEERPQPYVRLWLTEALTQLATDTMLHASDFRVLGKILAAVQWGNVVCAPTVLWSRELGVVRQTVWRSLRAFLAKGIISPDFRRRPDHYVVSHALGYRGGLRHWALQRRNEAAQQELKGASLWRDESSYQNAPQCEAFLP